MAEDKRVYLITHPRSASNLLVQILGLEDHQPSVISRTHAGYYFLDTLYFLSNKGLRGTRMEDWSEEDKAETVEVYRNGFAEMNKYLDAAKEEGKMAVIKEHANLLMEPAHQSKFFCKQDKITQEPLTLDTAPEGKTLTRSVLNETVFSDEYLLTWKPVFLIRHPALMFPSYYRCMDDISAMIKKGENPARREGSLEDEKPDLSISMSLHGPRALYDFYAANMHRSAHAGEKGWPVIIDADDVIGEPEAVVKLAEMIGLDREGLQFEWEPRSEESKSERYNFMEKRMLSTLNESAGIQKDKMAANIDIEAEAVKWRADFGEIDGNKMLQWVKDAMPDYEYLKSRRIQA